MRIGRKATPQVWKGWRREGLVRSHGLILTTVLMYYLCITMSISMAWQRYLTPTIILSAVLSGIGVTQILQAVTGAVAALMSL